ncbi:MAG: hypothetical protein A2406_00195 [Candidatus Komeilibacteria bacterium RIFOXYC1_FULL_37_11]|uniref:DUF1761 domain-containing protein n=1 Tax=Candidatus Komeilibacteria bacterium RIFOXYC1_FULL_37_11 TaxID=1798555 RepID=A0A1G2C0G6_9BACT|nr:MAG: hypothetical protein A2406_00195 [Candidatus Komeilibacteria bacterium RIFOXYC1_FULL_37_11]OGY95222.1 MAG: hypothetical protein A2611_00760 [Candidatus Komeilibacteria bacterium RIFOXYD1_FULL_37_29]OGY96896.1 MAG: hypothetical protein A2543_00905 [Candidatus Komeilibacteria bacterium RIFOXYD2_FULL_37_8]
MIIIIVGFLGAVISAITGTLWYSGSTPMGKWHMQYLGFDKLSPEEKNKMIAEAKPKMWKSYSAQIILSFLTSFFIAFVTSYTVQNGGPASAVYYYIPMIWIAFTVPMIGQNILWGNHSGSLAWKQFFSGSFYNLITFLIIAFVATLFF